MARKKKRAHSFEGKIRKGRFEFHSIEVPAAISKKIGIRGHVPIDGEVNGKAPLTGSLVPRAGGRHLIFLKSEIRKAVGADLGDSIHVAFDIDTRSREIPMPEEVEEALRAEGLLEAFALVSPSKRKWLLISFDEAVAETTRAKRLGLLLAEAHMAREKKADRDFDKGQ